MFVGAKIKNFIGIENKDFENSVSLDFTFCGFSGVPLLNLSTWRLKPSSLYFCFYNIEVEKLDVSNFNVENILELDYLFYSEYLKEIHIRNWNTRNVTKIGSHFFNYNVLEKVYLNLQNNSKIVSALTENGFICNNDLCSKNTTIPTTILTTIPTIGCIDMFNYCNHKDILNEIESNIGQYCIDCEKGVDYCFGYMGDDGRNKIVYKINNDPDCILTSKVEPKYFPVFNSIKLSKLEVLENNFIDLNCLFSGAEIDNLDLTKLNIESAMSINFMFERAKIKNIIGLENKDFVNNVSLWGTFYGFSVIPLLNLSTWYLKPSSLDICFESMEVEKLDVSNFNLENLLELYCVFYSEYLKEIHIRNWNTWHIKHISDFFFNYDVLEKVYLNIENNPLIVYKLREHGFICEEDLCKKN